MPRRPLAVGSPENTFETRCPSPGIGMPSSPGIGTRIGRDATGMHGKAPSTERNGRMAGQEVNRDRRLRGLEQLLFGLLILIEGNQPAFEEAGQFGQFLDLVVARPFELTGRGLLAFGQ